MHVTHSYDHSIGSHYATQETEIKSLPCIDEIKIDPAEKVSKSFNKASFDFLTIVQKMCESAINRRLFQRTTFIPILRMINITAFIIRQMS